MAIKDLKYNCYLIIWPQAASVLFGLINVIVHYSQFTIPFSWFTINSGTDKLDMDIFFPNWASLSQWGIKFPFTEICGKYQDNNFQKNCF